MCAQFLDRVKYGNGHDGSPAVSGTINSYATCTGTIGETSLTTTLSASNGDIIFIHQSQGTGAGQWEINQVSADAGAILTLSYPLTYTYSTGAQVVLVPQYTGGTLSGAVTCTAWNGSIGGIIALMSNGDLTISGSLTTAGQGFRGGSYNGPGQGITGYQGEGYTGTGTTSKNSNTSGGGGGDYLINQAPGGGGGGNGTSGSTAPNQTNGDEGIGGSSTGNESLTSMFLAGGGGTGATGNDSNSQCYGGGDGGGIILIISKNLTITGTISANGADGGSDNYGGGAGGSGGGAGGSILMKVSSAVLGTLKITSIGGIGGDGQGDGGDGGVGRIHIDYSDTISGTTNPTINSTQVTTLKVQTFGGII